MIYGTTHSQHGVTYSFATTQRYTKVKIVFLIHPSAEIFNLIISIFFFDFNFCCKYRNIFWNHQTKNNFLTFFSVLFVIPIRSLFQLLHQIRVLCDRVLPIRERIPNFSQRPSV